MRSASESAHSSAPPTALGIDATAGGMSSRRGAQSERRKPSFPNPPRPSSSSGSTAEGDGSLGDRRVTDARKGRRAPTEEEEALMATQKQRSAAKRNVKKA